MSKETLPLTVDHTPLDVKRALIHAVAKKGFTIEGGETYEDRRYLRTAEISDSRFYSFVKPIKGYGKGTTIEAALVRALYTQTQYETHNIHPHDIAYDSAIEPNIDKARSNTNPTPPSQLDALFDDRALLWLIREDTTIAATCQSEALGNGSKVLTERDPDPLSALELLVSRYHFRRQSQPKIMRLPVTLLRP